LRKLFSSKGKILSSVIINHDFQGGNKTKVYLDEAYLDLFLNACDIRIGKQEISLGKVEYNSLSDILNKWNYSDFLDNEEMRIGSFAIKSSLYIGPIVIEGFLMPFSSWSILPEPLSRWSFIRNKNENIALNDSDVISLPVNYQETYPEKNVVSLKDMNFAAKIGISTNGADINLCYLHGISSAPEIFVDKKMSSDMSTVNVLLDYRSNYVDIISTNIEYVKGSSIIRAETGMCFDQMYLGKNAKDNKSFFRYTLQYELNTNSIIKFADNSSITAIWSQDVPVNSTEYSYKDITHLFDNSLAFLFNMVCNSFLELKLKGIANLKRYDYYVQPQICFYPLDNIAIINSVDILQGKKNTFFGGFENNTRYQLKIHYSF